MTNKNITFDKQKSALNNMSGNPLPDITTYFWINDFSIEEYTLVYDVLPRDYWSAAKEENGRFSPSGINTLRFPWINYLEPRDIFKI